MMKRCGPDSSIPTQMAMEALLGKSIFILNKYFNLSSEISFE